MEKTIYQKLADVRVAVQKRAIKKSGKNKFANFDYFELKDFLTISNEEMAKEGLCPIFNISPKRKEMDTAGNVTETDTVATLRIHDGKDIITFTMATADAATKGQLPIQALGSLNTYCKRYLYMNALELAEDDSIDATTGKTEEKKEEKKVVNATPQQVALLEKMSDTQKTSVFNHFKVTSFKDLTVKEASEVLAKMENTK